MSNIIAITGKLGSGKSELVKTFLKEGYTLLKFASSLKDLVSNLLNVDREFIETNKDNYSEYIISYEVLANELDLTVEDITTIRESNKFATIREVLQFIGTDIIRAYAPTWHADKLDAKITPGVKYCIDDLRFLNETSIINRHGGTIVRIARDNRSVDGHGIAHASELEQDQIVADYTIENDGTLEELNKNALLILEKLND
ncbi:hypothetical protein KAR91_01435 [Candidatus Pacearchaeota archaeon]|nr:hypothetical protein [Candidatus Pacearchaeota archaeon]